MKKLIMLYFFLAGGIAANAKNIDYTYLKMQSAPFEVDDDYLSKHDIVYFSPTQLEAEGFPMGNGDIGGMVWNHDNGIELQINKNDLWTKAQPEELRNVIVEACGSSEDRFWCTGIQLDAFGRV